MLTDLEQEIQDYTNSIKSGELPEVPELPELCPRCGKKVDKYKLHDQRKRTFLVIVGVWVKAMVTWMLRFRCPNPDCNRRFTYYPDFALPYKRYALPVVAELSEKAVCEAESYMEATSEGGKSIGYQDGRLLEPTTVWRWASYFGSLSKLLSNALDMIQKKSPASKALRKIKPVDPCKYRSEKRKLVLQIASRLLSIRGEYKKIFSRPVFPRFARGSPRK